MNHDWVYLFFNTEFFLAQMRRNYPHQNTEGTSFQTPPHPPKTTGLGVISSSITRTLMLGPKKETSDPETTHARRATASLYSRRDIRHCFCDGSQTKWHVSDMWGDRQITDSTQKDIYTSQNNSHLFLSAPICWWGWKACVGQRDRETKLN